ncbi:MAG: hypothetical protein RJQ09_12740 [Cyclobacteriaceae bacterium]
MKAPLMMLFVLFSSISFGQVLPKGQVIDTVKCIADNSQSYALYLPSNYSINKQWPVIFIFEPAARGQLPVDRYSELAEEFGYILMGSYNSKNGPRELSFDAFQAMMNDAEERFSIDNNRLYATGFSGGARASIGLAVYTKQIRGVISCAGSYPSDINLHPTEEDNFLFAGIVGDMDMNYHEHGRWRQKMDSINIDNTLVHFHAGHQWPPADVYRKALEWMEIKESPEYAQQHFKNRFQEVKDSLKNENTIAGNQILEQLKRDTEKTAWTQEAEKLYTSLIDSKELKKAQKKADKTASQEQDLIDQIHQGLAWVYQNSLSPQLNVDSIKYSLKWWDNEISKLHNMIDSKHRERQLLGHRMIDITGRNSGVKMMQLMQVRSYGNSIPFIKIWIMCTPDQPWPYFNMARALAFQNQTDEALFYLEKAVELGYPPEYLQAPEFSNLEGNARLEELRGR